MLNTTFIRNSRGFTLIELLVTLAIVGIMMTAVYAVYISNVRAVKIEENRVEIQQDQRIAIDFLARELRVAGYDKEESGLPGIVDARSNYIYFTVDRNDDGDLDDGATPPLAADVDEAASFCLYNSAAYGGQVLGYTVGNLNDVNPADGKADTDEINDNNNVVGVNHTHNGVAHQALGLVDNIEFLYHFGDGTLDTLDPGALGKLDDIRGVTISLVTRADDQDMKFMTDQSFTPASNDPNYTNAPLSGIAWDYLYDPIDPNRGVRRRIIYSTVRFRNMGLD